MACKRLHSTISAYQSMRTMFFNSMVSSLVQVRVFSLAERRSLRLVHANALQLRNDKCLLTTRIEGTPYHGGWFRVGFTFGDDFPASPPKCESVSWTQRVHFRRDAS